MRKVFYRYSDGKQALNNVTFEIKTGQRVAVLGNNGAGKSTLFMLLNGIHKPSSGNYLFDGLEVAYSKRDLFELRKKVGVVFQDIDSQLFTSSVYDELSFGPMNLKLPIDDVKRRIAEIMLLFDIESLKDKPPHLLSYGQKKRVAIASILTMKPQVLVLDEPFSGLDSEHAGYMMNILSLLHTSGSTILLSTHDVDFAYQWADVVMLLHDGCVERIDDTMTIFSDFDLLQRCGLPLPTILQVYNTFSHRCVSKKMPRSIEDLNFLISSL